MGATADGAPRAFARVGAAVLFVLYPLAVWWGLSHGRPRLVALILLGLAIPLALVRIRGRSSEAARSLAVLPLVTVAALALGAILDEAGYVLAVPAVINGGFLIAFGATLAPGSVPMIERFARLQVAEPTPAQQAWCRLWTWIWCGFFVVNGTAALLLALWAPVFWWAFYTGLLSYIAMGVLFATEWWLRRRRFHRG